MVLYLFLTHSLINHCRRYLHLTPYQIINANRTRIFSSLNLIMFIIYLQTNPSIDATHGNRLPNARKCEKCTTTLLPDTAPFKSSHRHTHTIFTSLHLSKNVYLPIYVSIYKTFNIPSILKKINLN